MLNKKECSKQLSVAKSFPYLHGTFLRNYYDISLHAWIVQFADVSHKNQYVKRTETFNYIWNEWMNKDATMINFRRDETVNQCQVCKVWYIVWIRII